MIVSLVTHLNQAQNFMEARAIPSPQRHSVNNENEHEITNLLLGGMKCLTRKVCFVDFPFSRSKSPTW